MKKEKIDCSNCGGTGKILRYSPLVLRETREQAGVGLREMARATGYSAPFISDIELGRRNPNKDIIKYLESL